MSFDLIKRLEIRHCILVGNLEKEKLIFNARKFSSMSIPVSHLNYDPLMQYIDGTQINQFKTGLIFKEENLHILEEISSVFERVSS